MCGAFSAEWLHITRILLMVPMYAVVSFLSLLLPEPGPLYLDLIRDSYEAYVLYQFIVLLIAYCGGRQELYRAVPPVGWRALPPCAGGVPRGEVRGGGGSGARPRGDAPVATFPLLGRHPWPLCGLAPFAVDHNFVVLCKRCVLQYAWLKPVLAVAAIITHLAANSPDAHRRAVGSVGLVAGVYNQNSFRGDSAYVYIFAVYNVTVSISLYYLVLFGVCLEPEISPYSPVLKFLCIKAIIFFAFWQGCAIAVMGATGLLGGDCEVTMKLQDFLICVEMAGIAWAHRSAFGYAEMCAEVRNSPQYERHLPQLAPSAAREGMPYLVRNLLRAGHLGDMREVRLRAEAFPAVSPADAGPSLGPSIIAPVAVPTASPVVLRAAAAPKEEEVSDVEGRGSCATDATIPCVGSTDAAAPEPDSVPGSATPASRRTSDAGRRSSAARRGGGSPGPRGRLTPHF
eukprot:gene19724-5710_t